MSRIIVFLLLVLAGSASLVAAALLLLQRADSTAGALESEATIPPLAAQELPTAAPATQGDPPPVSSPPPSNVTVYLQDGEQRATLSTAAPTVRKLLEEAGIAVAAGDWVSPPPETPLVEQMQIEIRRAIPLTIQVDGQTLAIFSSARSVREAIAGAGIGLGELDRVEPALDSPPAASEIIRVVRVREETVVEDQVIPFQTVYQPSADLDLDTKAVISGGVPGVLRQTTLIRYEDGVEVARETGAETVGQEPVNEVIGYGTRITTQTIETPEGTREYWRVVRMRATAYTVASAGKPPDHPSYGITASGLPAGTGIVAVDPNVIPFRSEVYVPGYGVGFAGDTGGGVKGRWIDLGYDEDELQTWNGHVDVYYLTPIPAEINYLLPEVLP